MRMTVAELIATMQHETTRTFEAAKRELDERCAAECARIAREACAAFGVTVSDPLDFEIPTEHKHRH